MQEGTYSPPVTSSSPRPEYNMLVPPLDLHALYGGVYMNMLLYNNYIKFFIQWNLTNLNLANPKPNTLEALFLGSLIRNYKVLHYNHNH